MAERRKKDKNSRHREEKNTEKETRGRENLGRFFAFLTNYHWMGASSNCQLERYFDFFRRKSSGKELTSATANWGQQRSLGLKKSAEANKVRVEARNILFLAKPILTQFFVALMTATVVYNMPEPVQRQEEGAPLGTPRRPPSLVTGCT